MSKKINLEKINKLIKKRGRPEEDPFNQSISKLTYLNHFLSLYFENKNDYIKQELIQHYIIGSTTAFEVF